MNDDCLDFAGDGTHGRDLVSMDQLDAPLPFGDWAELGRRILAEAARRAIAEGVTTFGNASGDAERCSRIAMVSEDCV